MIGLRKLRRLPTDVRFRKCLRVLVELEQSAHAGEIDRRYLVGVIRVLQDTGRLDQQATHEAEQLLAMLESARLVTPEQSPTSREPLVAWPHSSTARPCPTGPSEGEVPTRPPAVARNRGGDPLVRAISNLRFLAAGSAGETPADWDLRAPDGTLRSDERRTLPMHLFLEDLRSPFNVGSILRTAEALGVSSVFVSPRCARPDHRRAARSAMGAAESVTWQVADLADAAQGKTVFAVEGGGISVGEYTFPQQGGLALLGSEELGLSPEALEAADRSGGRVTVPLPGAKGSLNVGVACGIVLFAWSRQLVST